MIVNSKSTKFEYLRTCLSADRFTNGLNVIFKQLDILTYSTPAKRIFKKAAMILMIATFANLGAGLYEAFPEVRPHALDFTYTGIACLFSGIIAYRMSIDKIFKLGDKNYNEKKKWRLEKI